MMKYFDGETLTPDEVRHGLMVGAKAGKFVPVFFTAATEGLGVAPLLDTLVSLMPSPAEARPRVATHQATGEAVASWRRPGRPAGGPGLQDPGRSVRGQAAVPARLLGQLRGRFARVQRQPGRGGAHRPGLRAARQGADHHGPHPGRRHRRRGQAAAHPYRRHVRRQGHAPRRCRRSSTRSRCSRWPSSRSPRPTAPSSAPALQRMVERGPDAASPTYEDSTHELILSGMGESPTSTWPCAVMHDKFGVSVEHLDAARALPRDDHTLGHGPVPSQEADRRRRAVRRGAPARRAAGARRRLRVRQRGRSAAPSRPSSSRPSRRASRPCWTRASSPTARWSTSRPSSTTARSTRSTRRTSPSRSPGARPSRQAVPGRRPGAARAGATTVRVMVPSGQMGDVLGDLNTRRAMVQGMEQMGNQGHRERPRCRWPRCSATPPTFAR